MNTLNKSITCKFFKSPEDYARMRQAWSSAMQSRTKLAAPYHALYLILCGKNWLKAFNQQKRFEHPAELSFVRVRYQLNASPPRRSGQQGHLHERNSPYDFFAEFLSDDAENQINALLPKVMEIGKSVKQGVPIEPYTLPLEVVQNG